MKGISKTFLNLFIFSSILGCSNFSKDDSKVDAVFGTKEYADSLVSELRPLWYTGSNEFKLVRSNGEDSTHLLIDSKPSINLNKKTINFIVKTPARSDYRYDIDFDSGQRYVSKKYCAQEDVWESYTGEIYKPNYTDGYIPRILDQLGDPQGIIVFGGEEYINQNYSRNFFDARIIGGFIEQICPAGGCLKPSEWKSRIKLVGVLNGDDNYKEIDNLEKLKEEINWDYTKAFIENGQGKNRLGSELYPATRVGAFLSASQALNYIDKNSIQLSNKKLLSMRKSCHKLYQYIWAEIGSMSEIEKEALKFDRLPLRKSYMLKNKNKFDQLFYRKFKKYFRKYHSEYMTCSKYIYPSNINDSEKRHWFFAYLTSVHSVIDLGYSFSCDRSVWTLNPVKANGKKVVPVDRSFAGCDARAIDYAFEFAPTYLEDLRNKKYESYRYVDYDRGIHGTHEKIYSWVKTDPRQFQCLDGQNNGDEIIKSTFPTDIKWRRRSLQVRMATGEHL